MIRLTQLLALLSLLTLTVGCNTETPEPAADAPAPTTPAANEPAAKTPAKEEGHSHGEGPNGGAVADWGGGKYHVEFTVNHDTQEATVYILGSDAKSPAPIASETLLLSIEEPSFQVDLTPSPLEGEAEGTSSRFVGKHENLGIVQEFAGTISGEVESTPYAGDFEEVAHAHE